MELYLEVKAISGPGVVLGCLINSSQPQLSIFDIFLSAELTVTAVGESNHLVTLSLSEVCEMLSSCVSPLPPRVSSWDAQPPV